MLRNVSRFDMKLSHKLSSYSIYTMKWASKSGFLSSNGNYFALFLKQWEWKMRKIYCRLGFVYELNNHYEKHRLPFRDGDMILWPLIQSKTL